MNIDSFFKEAHNQAMAHYNILLQRRCKMGAARIQKKIIERRGHDRHEYVSPIILVSDRHDADLKRDDGTYVYARMCNHSVNGLYFESDYELQAGSWIFFSRSNFLSGFRDFNELCGYGAKIKWCRQLPAAEAFSYGIGAEYVKPFTILKSEFDALTK